MQDKTQIHQKALCAAGYYKSAEADLLEILQIVDERHIYLDIGCKSLFEYSTKELKLSESIAYNFIVVARKAREVPQLGDAIRSGSLSVPMARKITSVLTPANQESWIQLAISLPQKRLEQEVAKANPKEAVPERMKFVSEDRLNLQLGISEKLSLKFRRAQDLEAQRRKMPITLEETLESVLDFFLEKNDPVQKSAIAHTKKRTQPVLRQVLFRDQGQCTYKNKNGIRCAERRWLDVHHILPKSQGGKNTLENMITLCSAHHRMTHNQH